MTRAGDCQVGPWTSLFMDPPRIPWWGNPGGGIVCLQGRTCCCTRLLPTDDRTDVWGSCVRGLPEAWPGQVCRARWGWLDPLQEAKDVPTVTPFPGPVTPHLDIRGWRWPGCWRRKLLPDIQRWDGIPILGAGIDWGSIGSPLLNAWAGTSHSPLVPQSHPAAEQLSYSVKDLNLYTRPHRSGSRMQWGGTPISWETKETG